MVLFVLQLSDNLLESGFPRRTLENSHLKVNRLTTRVNIAVFNRRKVNIKVNSVNIWLFLRPQALHGRTSDLISTVLNLGIGAFAWRAEQLRPHGKPRNYGGTHRT